MRRARIFLILGIWITILPYLGFPYSWKDVLTTLSGLGLIGMSYMLYRELKTKEVKKEKTFDNFSENEFKEEEINNQVS